MKRKILIVIATVILLVGLGFLLFPPVSNFIGKQQADAAADTFDNNVESVVDTLTSDDGVEVQSASEAKEKGFPTDKKGAVTDKSGKPVLFKSDLERLRDDSLAYNKSLLTGQGTSDTVDYERKALTLSDYGITDDIYGYLTAETIDMKLPIYLGATYYIMSFGSAHLYGTSLPVGDDTSNIALAGHTYYVGRIFFDNLKKLNIGDRVTITNYWEDMNFKVIGNKTVTADQVNDLLIQDGRQLLTLITCTPNSAGDFDRYLVICEREK